MVAAVVGPERLRAVERRADYGGEVGEGEVVGFLVTVSPSKKCLAHFHRLFAFRRIYVSKGRFCHSI
jgi:hypothetical protein